MKIYSRFLKRPIDFVLSTLGMLLLLPVFVLTSILLLVANKGTPFFFQARPGKYNRIFKVIKFKTMTDEKDINGNLLPDECRLTPIGKFIRKTSLDEIPQLLNVIKGDMSLIGPRPLLVDYLNLYNDEQKKRHNIRPGITGWAQVSGRNAISWEQKFKYDIWYVNNMSFLLDVKIIYLTLVKVLKSEGINSNTSTTMERFTGN